MSAARYRGLDPEQSLRYGHTRTRLREADRVILDSLVDGLMAERDEALAALQKIADWSPADSDEFQHEIAREALARLS